jgi:hypothetical protein
MLVLTPSGYVSPATLDNGAAVCAFDLPTGAPIINHVENIDFVDYVVWCRWWSIEDVVPPFNWVRVNNSFVLFCEQNVWRNDGVSYTHARELQIGDIIYDDHDNRIIITSLESYEDRDAIWYRFDIDNDHSYIIDGLTVHNASISWTGTGSWTPSNTANWVGGVVPGSADVVTFPASTGTCTVNFGGTISVQSITMGAFTSTWDNSVNNNNITLSAAAGFSGSGGATRTIKLGSATYNLTATAANWTFTTTTGLTFTGSSATVNFSGGTQGQRVFNGGGLSYGTLTLGANAGQGASAGALYQILQANTFGTLNLSSAFIQLPSLAITTVTNVFNAAGTPGAPIALSTSNILSNAQLAVASGCTLAWAAMQNITINGGSLTAIDSFDLGGNVNGTGTISIKPPSGLASSPIIIGRGTPY